MAEPREFRGWNGVLNTGMTLVMCMYTAVAFFGYLKYGDRVLGSITLNLPTRDWSVGPLWIMYACATLGKAREHGIQHPGNSVLILLRR